MKNSGKLVLDAQAITGTGTYVTSAIPLDLIVGYSIVITTTSTATGAAKLQASVDGVTFVDLPNSGDTANKAVAGAGSAIWNIPNAFYKQVRVSYTNATNSGTLSVTFFAKGF